MPSGLELYPHNEKAYRKLLDMLSGTRRACIIHPTGTGKAFIAYRYAFDHPNERILWMSPSTYIEQEQEASIRRELPNQEFKNIERMTYQTAMHRAQKGNLDIHADTVIFDEFHHTGAPQWSRGVEGVIECNPDANLIGLSATSIRYSDSGRDMSDELFDETAIKLLLCVNQLNEGVHIKGVDAVIMVRRTSSPTIFYQQLGRALTAAGNFEPLVIDLVDNFEMIGIEQIVSMMSESYARLSGENDPEELIPPSAFKVIDHEKDARNLAKNLERRLALRSEKLTIDEKIALWKGL